MWAFLNSHTAVVQTTECFCIFAHGAFLDNGAFLSSHGYSKVARVPNEAHKGPAS
jgi:hypothetical protein